MALTSTFSKILDKSGTLSEQRLSEAHREPLKRLARGVLIAIGIALCSASPAGMAQPLPKLDPYKYAYFQINEKEAKCLFQIAAHESGVNYKAHNKSSGAYGAWQIINPKVAKLSPLKQVDWAIRYANKRYGSSCKAWSRWKVQKWW